jgi:hypothetical protein
MARPASYYRADGTLVGLSHVRVVENPVKTGDLAGTNLSYAEVQEVRIRIILDRTELVALGVTPARNDIVVLASDRGYVLDNIMPPDGMTVSAEATRMLASELAGKTLPEDIP